MSNLNINEYTGIRRSVLPAVLIYDTLALSVQMEENHDYDGGIADANRCSAHPQNDRAHRQDQAQYRRDRRISTWWQVAHQARGVTQLHREEAEQKISAGPCQRTNNLSVAVRLLATVLQAQASNPYTSYRYAHYTILSDGHTCSRRGVCP